MRLLEQLYDFGADFAGELENQLPELHEHEGPDLLAEAAAIRLADEMNATNDPTGIERARIERWRDHSEETRDWLANVLAWSNYWRAGQSERLRWLAIAERIFG